VSTANFTNLGAPLEILERIEGFMKEEGISDLNQLVGALLDVSKRRLLCNWKAR
jgi:hypothetical protein